jgi:hypothetical protein
MFRFDVVRSALAAVLVSYATSLGVEAQVNFNSPSPPAGTAYGAGSGNSAGQIIPGLGQDGIKVSVENFFAGSFTGLYRAEVHGGGTDNFATKHMYLDNISLGFDLAGVGFPVNQLTIEYHEFGGVDNFSVNGGAVIELPALTSLPVNIAPGVTASADIDSITLSGTVSRFLIGGQELAIDNIIATPEPTCLALVGVGGLALLRRIHRSRP